MGEETEAPTRVEPVSRAGIRAEVAHGPEKVWEQVGERVNITITPLARHVRALRAEGYVLTRIFDEAAAKLIGGAELEQLDAKLRANEAERRVLEAVRIQLLERKRADENAEQQQRGLEADIRALVGIRNLVDYSLNANRAWVKERKRRMPRLAALKEDEILELMRAAGGGAPDVP